jgi:hypothetical protein
MFISKLCIQCKCVNLFQGCACSTFCFLVRVYLSSSGSAEGNNSFPLFHQQTLLHNVARREYLSNQPAFSDIMSICALASARARDGAVFSGRWPTSYFQQASTEAFFSAAKDAMPRDLSAMRGLQGMRTCIILALYGIQVGKIDIMHQYLGMYHSFIAMDGLHNEMNWPKNIGIVEVEERRRLV